MALVLSDDWEDDEHRASGGHGPMSLLDKLPSDIMVRVQDFLELRDRVHCAASSKPLRKLIFHDCAPLWRQIDFSNLSSRAKIVLTDDMLSSLLIRVNARAVTKSLNIQGCDILRGTGLASLSGSEVLEKLDLFQDSFRSSLVADILVPILRTMIPYKLSVIRYRHGHLHEDVPETLKCFLRDLEDARMKQLRQKQIVCAACPALVGRDSGPIVPYVCGGPRLSCGTCERHFCRHGSCPMGLKDCEQCGATSCEGCAECKRCDWCNGTFCGTCIPFFSCDGCQKDLCADDCFYQSNSFACLGCDMKLCEQCNERQNEAITYCECCYEGFCSGCKEMKTCQMCHSPLCDECGDFNYLDCCDIDVCSFCMTPEQCNVCERKFCGDEDLVATCDICEKIFCDECATVFHCDSCSKSFCSLCRQVNYFSCSGELQCELCATPSRCDVCLETFHPERVNECGACSKLLCERCRSKQCGACRKSFCNSDDCALVDTCEMCENTCCKDCACFVRCTDCNVSSCKECRRGGGSCNSCNERPAKRVRLSSCCTCM